MSQNATLPVHCAFDELLDLKKIKPNSRNRNKHPKDQIERLIEILNYQGFRHPLIISKRSGLLVVGHGRLAAAKKMKIKQVPVKYQDFDSDEQETAFAISDNAISAWAELDLSGINLDLADLGPDFDINLLGIKNFTIDVFEKEELTDPDSIPEHVDPKAKLGDIYQLGEHRLMCGDSTNIQHVEALMDGHKPVLMVTDPPYGVKLDQSWRDKALGSKALGKGNKNLVSNDDRADWYDVWAICDAPVAYVWHASAFSDVVMDSLRRAGYEIKQQIIWNKSVMVMGRQAYHWKHEPCWYAVKKGCDQNWKGDRKQVTVWDAAPPTHIMAGSKEDKTEHPTQKPISLYEIPINNHTDVGDVLYEPFSGSGSGFIACEKTKRRMYGMELDPKYVDIIIARWEKYTGKTAELINA